MKKLTTDEFIVRCMSHQRHIGMAYDYSEVVYTGIMNQVTVLCKKHGAFSIKANEHINGKGCIKCGYEKTGLSKRSSTDRFLSSARLKHKDKNYDYSNVAYTLDVNNIIVGCPKHGEFSIQARNFRNGRGCQKCGEERRKVAKRKSVDDFIEQSLILHANKDFDYSLVDYKGAFVKVDIVCRKHGVFSQTPDNHLDGHSCPKCNGVVSSYEIDVLDFIKRLNVDVKGNVSLNGGKDYRFDAVIESKKLAIEVNGVYWHSIAKKEPMYHVNKRKFAESLGYEMVSIWEDDIAFKKDKVFSLLLRKINGVDNKIAARKTKISKVSYQEAKSYHEKYHIQDFHTKLASEHYASFYEGDIIAIGSFDKNGVLHRYTVKNGISYIGGLNKTISGFRRNNGNKAITTYCDRDYFSGGLYKASGFNKVSESKQLTYSKQKKRYRRETFMKNKLPKIFGDVDMSKTEQQICLENNVYACYNSGIDKYVLT